MTTSWSGQRSLLRVKSAASRLWEPANVRRTDDIGDHVARVYAAVERVHDLVGGRESYPLMKRDISRHVPAKETFRLPEPNLHTLLPGQKSP